MLVMSWNIYRRTIDDFVRPAGRQNNSLWLAEPHNLDRSLQHITNVRGLDFFFCKSHLQIQNYKPRGANIPVLLRQSRFSLTSPDKSLSGC